VNTLYDKALGATLGGAILAALVCVIGVTAACTAPTTETIIKGDREVVQVTAGKLLNGAGDARYFYILRDKDTGVDYLAVVDAGIVKLEPKPAMVPMKVEK
jgi:hypothetical protein